MMHQQLTTTLLARHRTLFARTESLMQTRIARLAMITVLAATATSLPLGIASGQSIWQTIKQQAAAKAAAAKAKADSAVVNAAGKAVDSTVSKTGQAGGTVVDMAGSVVDTTLNKTHRGVQGLLSHSDGASSKLATDLAAGRAVIWDITFAPGADDLAPESSDAVTRLASALNSAPAGAFLLEVHVDSAKDAASDQDLSDRRAKMLKAKLVSLGVKSPVFASGQGSARHSTDTAHKTNARVEVSKAQ
jgi:outer membrane protein OmpA-like peptidoglycan-associated protein